MRPFRLYFTLPLSCILLILSSCSNEENSCIQDELVTTKKEEPAAKTYSKIPVLNFGSFHFGYTSDATSTEFDEKNAKNQKDAHEIARLLAEFKPTVIIVESPPEQDAGLQKVYQAYLENPDYVFDYPTETELIAFEVGRLSGATRIYGVDHRMNYNYRIDEEIVNTIDSNTCKEYNINPFKTVPSLDVDDNDLSLFEKLVRRNSPEYLDFMFTTNAEILTHAGTDGNFEGADEATRFYQRNLRMYSNLNRIELSKDDRVFILMGAAHTAFFSGFLSRSPKYDLVETYDYLK